MGSASAAMIGGSAVEQDRARGSALLRIVRGHMSLPVIDREVLT
jgi:hypothetical protein